MTYNEMTKLIGDPVITLDVDDIFLIGDILRDNLYGFGGDGREQVREVIGKIDEQFETWKNKAKGIA